MNFINSFFNFILILSKKYNIDESHGIRHSMEVLHFANDIYTNEIKYNPYLKDHKNIIYSAALLHDMCDKKYVNETEGIIEINNFLEDKLDNSEIIITNKIISTMSYSTVKKFGYPKDLGEYELAYHIVREADLLAAYDFERCMIYNMHRLNGDFENAFNDSKNLFENRVFKHLDDNLFVTNYSKKIAVKLESKSIKQINKWTKVLKQLK
jgi:HD superfamily phosphodiesterase